MIDYLAYTNERNLCYNIQHNIAGNVTMENTFYGLNSAELEMRSSHVSILPSAGEIEIMFWAPFSLVIKSQ